MSTCPELVERIRGVKIGKNSARNQSKAMIPQNKNKNFRNFLTVLPASSYERRATRNGYIFVSKVQVALIIEGVFFYSLSLPPVCAYLLFCRGLLFSPPAKSSQLTLKRSGNPLGEWTMNYEPFTSIENPTLAHFSHFRHFRHFIPLYTCRDASTNHPFLCKTNPISKKVKWRKSI